MLAHPHTMRVSEDRLIPVSDSRVVAAVLPVPAVRGPAAPAWRAGLDPRVVVPNGAGARASASGQAPPLTPVPRRPLDHHLALVSVPGARGERALLGSSARQTIAQSSADPRSNARRNAAGVTHLENRAWNEHVDMWPRRTVTPCRGGRGRWRRRDRRSSTARQDGRSRRRHAASWWRTPPPRRSPP